MLSNRNNNDQNLFAGIKGILDNSDLKTFEKMIMIVIKMYQKEYGTVFPDYDTIANAGGMSKRKAQYVVKDLQERNLIEKVARFKTISDGSKKQTSNQYILLDNTDTLSKDLPDEQYAPAAETSYASGAAATESLCEHGAPYKAGFTNLVSLNPYSEEENYYITREREVELKKYACYAQVYKKMIADQGTGLLSFKQSEFLDTCRSYNLPLSLVNTLYPQVSIAIQKYDLLAIPRTFDKFVIRLAKKRIDNPIAWFVTTFRNEDLMVKSERQLEEYALRVC